MGQGESPLAVHEDIISRVVQARCKMMHVRFSLAVRSYY